jgi:hypothetical protein
LNAPACHFSAKHGPFRAKTGCQTIDGFANGYP